MLEDEKKEVERNEVQKEEEKEVVRKGTLRAFSSEVERLRRTRMGWRIRWGGGQGNNPIARCTASCEKPTDDAVGS